MKCRVTSDPAAPLKTASFFESFAPSLMPRSSMHQGMAAGLSVLAAELVGRSVDAAVTKFVPDSSPFIARFGARAVATGIGYGLTQIPQTRDEATPVASARTVGRLAMAGGVGGMVYEAASELRTRYPNSGPIRPILTGVGGFAGALLYSDRLLKHRRSVIRRWSEDDKPADVAMSLVIGAGVTVAGRAVGRGFMASREGAQTYFGDDVAQRTIGRLLNGLVWAGGAAALYSAGVGYIARANEKVEPAYSEGR